MSLFLILLLLLPTLIQCISYQQQQILRQESVYSSLQVVEMPISNICNSQILSSIITLQGTYQDYFFAMSDQCGLVLSQLSIAGGSYTFIKSYPSIMSVSAISFNHQTNTLWVADHSNVVTVYDASNPLQLNKKNQISCSLLTSGIAFSSDNQQSIFFQSTGNVQINYIGDGKITVVQSFINPNSPASIIIIPQSKLLILGGYNLYFYAINNSSYDPTQPYSLQSYQQIVSGDNTPQMYFVDNKYLFTWSSFTGLNQYDISACLQTQVCNASNVIMTYSQKQLILGFTFVYLTKDTNYFIVFYNFFGIYIYDVSQRQGFVQYYSITMNGLNNAMGISQDESFIITTLNNQFNVYQKVISNLNIDAPNILNLHQNNLVTIPGTVKTTWHCYVDGNSNVVVNRGAGGVFFLNVNQIDYSLTQTNYLSFNFANNIVDESRLLKYQYSNYIVICPGELLYFYLRNADFSTMTLVSIYTPPMTNAHFGNVRQSLDGNTLFVSAGYVGLIVVDITDITNPKHVTNVYYTFPQAPACQSKNIWISSDQKLLYMTYRYLGVVVYDISNVSNPQQVSVIYTQGGEDVILTQDNKNMIIVETIYGYSFWSLVPDRIHPVKQASLLTMGYAVHLHLLQNDEFILTTSLYRGQLFLIDYRNRANPVLIQSYQYQNVENTAGDVCISADESYSYLSYPNGIVVIPLRNPVVFHTDIIWLQPIPNSSQEKQILMNPVSSTSSSKNLQVGMNVVLQLSQLYQVNIVQLINAYYYDSQQMKALPFWISINQGSLSISISVDKSALDQNQIQNLVNNQIQGSGITDLLVVKQQILYFQLSERVANTDFIQATIGITQALSAQIFSDCVLNQIILSSGFVNPSFSIDEIAGELTNAAYTPSIIQSIQYTLRNKITFYPISFYIQNSLFLDIYSTSQIITSFASSLTVNFYLNATFAQFVNRNYPSVLTSFSDKFDQIQVIGDLSSINLLLQSGVKIANFTTTDQIEMKIAVNDGINYDVYKNFFVNETSIISLTSPTTTNPELSLQDDFNHKFQGGIAILTKFDYQIGSDVFLNKDTTALSLQAYILSSNGTYVPLQADYWLGYDQTQKVFTGTPPTSQYNNVINLKIVASDGYTNAEGLFKISVNSIPVSYILTILFQILGPVFGLIGLWRYSSSFYNIIYKGKHETSLIKLIAGDEITLQIPLVKEEMRVAKELWGRYFKQVSKSDLIVALRYHKEQYSQARRLKSKLVKQQQIAELQDAPKQSDMTIISQINQNQHDNTITPFQRNQNTSKMGTIVQNAEYVSATPSPLLKQSYDIEGASISNQKDQKLSTLRQPRVREDSQKVTRLQKQLSIFEKKQQKKSQMITNKNQLNSSQDKQQKYSQDNTFFDSRGHINSQFILSQLIKFLENGKKGREFERIVEQLSNPKSKLSRCICGLAAISIAQFDESTMKIIEYLKSKATEKYTNQDWYKFYVIITPHIELVQTQPFPTIEIDDESLYDTLTIFGKFQEEKDETEDITTRFYIPLIEDSLLSIAYGFTFEESFLIPNPFGECLQMKAHSLKCIESYIPITESQCRGLRSALDMEFVQKELIDNSKLNSWIQQVDISNNVILIKGKPQNKDIGRYLFKIKDQLGYTVKRINVEVAYNRDLEDMCTKVELLRESLKYKKQSSHENINLIGDYNIAHEGQSTEGLQMMLSHYNSSTNKNSQNMNTVFYTTNQDELMI